MSLHHATVHWRRRDLPEGYSREHTLTFGSDLTVPGSASPSVVPLPLSSTDALDPEAAFVASISACHMLWFLAIAEGAGHPVAAYVDRAEGTLGRLEGRTAISEVVLRPEVEFQGNPPDAAAMTELHATAHRRCFIANSVKCPIRIEPQGAI